ncbi:NADH dehydrogenase [Striga hermonthica]|uniref:NADH dehydrogenase n=1 Tax=Striga hermonthica TaxID=68872 RepID=A0A9N7RLT0_STRHE|nr:NADH dehydrogenase [Striga hermonthica]
MGLGQLASRALIRSTRLAATKPTHLARRTISSTPDLHNAEAAAAAAQPEPDLPKRNPVAGARVHFPNPDDAIEVFVDGYPVKIPKGMTVLQACEIAGVDIPRFCYHSRLSIAGNCRMCLVEVEKSPKPVASCAMPALPGMKIKTDTPLAKKAREGVMEFLLMNHPLDCPICDQGGECDLQDQSMAFGSDRGRFTETKRSVVDKNLGPLVKTVMTRCIQCTRCVRFATEVAGVQDLGMLGRGSGEEIGTYVERLMTSELSGNVIDICPVGALTSKPFAFKARNWELKGTESIDVTDAVGSNIRIDSRGPEVMRVVPRLNEDFLNKMGSNNIWCEGNGPNPNADLRSGYIMNTSISSLEKADVFLLVGTQPRVEAAMVNARIRKTVRATNAKVGYVGPPADFNYDHEHLGTGPDTLSELAEGRHPFSSVLSSAKNPAIIVGAGVFERKDKDAIFSTLEKIARNSNAIRPDWNGLNTLLLNAAQAAALDLGLVPESGSSVETAKFLYLMGADDVDLEKLPEDAFVVYQGHHGDRGVYRANVILPASAFSEKEGTYVNTEGCAQTTIPAVPTVGDARDDWKIIRALSEVTGVELMYNTLSDVRNRMRTVAPNLVVVDEREPAVFSSSALRPEVKEKMDNKVPFGVAVENFYMTDSITRASKIMAQCSALLKK